MLSSLLLAFCALSAAPPQFTAGHVLVNDPDDGELCEFTADGVKLVDFGDDPDLGDAEDLVIGPDGRLYVSTFSSSSVLVYDASGAKVDEFQHAKLSGGRGMAIGPNGNLYVASYFQDRVLEFSLSGSLQREIGVGVLNAPCGIAFGPNGHLYVANLLDNQVHELDADGAQTRVIGAAEAPDATYLAIGAEGHLYVGSYASHSVFRFDAFGNKKAELVLNASGVDDIGFGPEGLLYVVDGFGLRTFDAQGGPVYKPGGFPGTGHAIGFAIVPYRFAATLKGTMTRDDGTTVKIKQKVELSIQPGSTTASMQFELPEQVDLDSLPYAMGTLFWTFHGTETMTAANGKARRFQGMEIPPFALERGVASVCLEIEGKTKDGAFIPSSAKGSVQRGNGRLQFQGKLSTGARLN